MTEPNVQPEPEDRDWTYVLAQGCGDCGFDPEFDRTEIPARIRAAASAFGTVLAAPGASDRPAPTVWSPVEYACHVRDVCTIMNTRAQLMLTQHDPQFQNWDQDATAIEERYWEQSPATVATALATAAEVAAATYAGVAADSWERPGRRSNGSVFTVDSLGRYFLHDLEHHVWDVTSD